MSEPCRKLDGHFDGWSFVGALVMTLIIVGLLIYGVNDTAQRDACSWAIQNQVDPKIVRHLCLGDRQ